MRLPIGFLLRIVKATQPPDGEYSRMTIIIRKPYAHLEKELRKTFKQQGNVNIIMDRRSVERRRHRQSCGEGDCS